MAASVKVLRKGGNPNNVKDWEVCSGDPNCPRHVHLAKELTSNVEHEINNEVEADIIDFLKNNPVSLSDKNINETSSIFATLFSGATVGLASGGGAVYIANAFNGGPIVFELGFGLAFLFGVMGGLIGGLAAYYSHSRSTRNLKADSLAKQYEAETGTVLSAKERKFFRSMTSLEITDDEHMQNLKNDQLAQEENNRKFLEEYNSAAKNG